MSEYDDSDLTAAEITAVHVAYTRRENKRRRDISKRWRAAKMEGRLYWKHNNHRWRDWDSGEIARSVEEVGGHKFYSIEAIIEWIETVGDEP